MRMWMCDPILPCNKHLGGEHFEIHLHRHNFVDHHSIDGRISPIVQIEPAKMKERHDALAAEMVRRGMRHQSPYEQPDISYLPLWQQQARVDVAASLADLCERCEECAVRYARHSQGILLK